MNQQLFRAIIRDPSTAKEIAADHNVTERMVYAVREAGTWERWPYIVTKKRHGYMTPEYKASLKKQGLPLRSPAKPTATHKAPRIKYTQKPSLFQGIKNIFKRSR